MSSEIDGRDPKMSSESKAPARARDYIPYVPLLFFIAWESGIIHSTFKLMTPMYVVSLVSGLSLLIFFSWKRFEKARMLGIIMFFIPFLLRNPVPYIFLLLAAIYYFYRNEHLLKTAFILLPIAIVDGLGLALNTWITLLITFIFFVFASIYDLGAASKVQVKPITKAALYISMTLLLISLSPIDPLGQMKTGKIAYDGFHHKLDSAFFENDTITHSTLRYLDTVGYETTILNKTISPESLKGISILVLETPEEKYSPQEIGYITDFVRNGGGLFVLGDHTNIMDCYTNLNPILHNFGLHLNFDYSMLWEPHFASLAGFDSTEETAGATLRANRSDAMILYALKYTTWADLGDWGEENHAYLGDVAPQSNEDYGVLPICAAVNYGNGRVLAIANSDCMSGPNLLYNYAFVVKVMSYLNHENSILRNAWFIIPLALLAALGIFRARGYAVIPLIVSASIIILLLTVQAAVPSRWEPTNMVALDVGHANIEGYGDPHQYKNVFVAIFAQHFGFNPVLVKDAPQDLSKYKAYITMGPTGPFSTEEQKNLLNYVENGGTLIVFDGYHSDISSDQSSHPVNTLLNDFGMSMNETLLGEISYFNYTTWGYHLPYMKETRIGVRPLKNPLMNEVGGNITMYSAVEVMGGTPIALYNNTPVMAVKKIGKGQIIVVGDHTIFKNFVQYEPIFSYPDPNLLKFTENLLSSIGGREENGL
ncbi:MAG: hypothetical protein ACE14P_01555 [Methanotrichaceae archaeon]